MAKPVTVPRSRVRHLTLCVMAVLYGLHDPRVERAMYHNFSIDMRKRNRNR